MIPTTPNSRLPTPRSSAIDRDLDWIVMKCLEKDRTRRYETANGLAADLEAAPEQRTGRRPSASTAVPAPEGMAPEQAGLRAPAR